MIPGFGVACVMTKIQSSLSTYNLQIYPLLLFLALIVWDDPDELERGTIVPGAS